MKLRKHLKSRRLVSVDQLGIDRIVDFQFGSGEAAYHVIVELYDRGNIALTDYEYTILNLLRVRTDADQDVWFAVREKYPREMARQREELMKIERLKEILDGCKEGESVRRSLNPHFVYGPAVIEHCLLEAGFSADVKIGKGFNLSEDVHRVHAALKDADEIMRRCSENICKGYIIQKQQDKVTADKDSDKLLTYEEFHPFLFRQHEGAPKLDFLTFENAVDDFFSKLGSQKLDMKALQQEKMAVRKLENVRKDHEKRLEMLHISQETDQYKAQLIESNVEMVERAILVLCNMIANAFDWTEISQMVKEAQVEGDPVAKAIKALKLESNKFTFFLTDPFEKSLDDGEDEEDGGKPKKSKAKGVLVDIDLGLSAYANARGYYSQKKHAAKKEQRTLEASDKALKAAERKTKQTLKEVAVATSIQKVRKTYWFEKFLWFVSSENFLVVAGRDAQQNEFIVKRHLRSGDVYVHADLHGATSCVVKNPAGGSIPPKTLQEAGCMALCYSSGWDSKIVTSAWWVHHDQVSKTAPTGEYLTTGSFMIRGKKNFLPPSQLVMGYTFVFKVDESCVENHLNERKVRVGEDDMESAWKEHSATDVGSIQEEDEEEDIEIEIDVGDDLSETASNAGVLETQMSSSSQFPDTSIDLQYVKGETFQLQRGISTMSTVSAASSTLVVEQLNAGDDDKEDEAEEREAEGENDFTEDQQTGKQRLTAKQRRDLKKQASKTGEPTGDDSRNQSVPTSKEEPKRQKSTGEAPVPMKRGQKHKLKKMRDKYGDQDEEERQLRMEILGSAGAQKEPKGKKGKKASKQQQQQKAQQEKRQERQQQKENPVILHSTEKESEKETAVVAEQQKKVVIREKKVGGEGVAASGDVHTVEDEDDEELKSKDDVEYLNALTGCPLPDDLLMFAIPMCAPYNAITNYKFKVKLTPGSGRRGKAARTAVHLFITSRDTLQREKDVLKSVKDAELSRNIPGKVKLSAPSLQSRKQRKK
ncbi:ribosome quality control complex subunit NEMF-like isoform X2 [Oscarella lobularis]